MVSGVGFDLRVLVGQPQRGGREVDELGLVGEQGGAGATTVGGAAGRLQCLLGLPPQLGHPVVGLLHAAARRRQRGVDRVVEAVALGVAQHAQRGLVGGDDRAVVEAPAVAELLERQALLAAQQEHEADHSAIFACVRDAHGASGAG